MQDKGVIEVIEEKFYPPPCPVSLRGKANVLCGLQHPRRASRLGPANLLAVYPETCHLRRKTGPRKCINQIVLHLPEAFPEAAASRSNHFCTVAFVHGLGSSTEPVACSDAARYAEANYLPHS